MSRIGQEKPPFPHTLAVLPVPISVACLDSVIKSAGQHYTGQSVEHRYKHGGDGNLDRGKRLTTFLPSVL